MKAYMNWSGGKDSSLALYHALQLPEQRPDLLFTNVIAAHNRISMHGVRRELLIAQANSIGLSLVTAELPEQPSMQEYEAEMADRVKQLKDEGYDTAIFGDIFLEDLKQYREQQLATLNIRCLFPLWKRDTKELMQEFIALGFKAIVVCVNATHLGESFCGRLIDQSFINALPDGVDVCGENGEYHSYVFDGPFFKQPVSFQKGELVFREYKVPEEEDGVCSTEKPSDGFYFCDLIPD